MLQVYCYSKTKAVNMPTLAKFSTVAPPCKPHSETDSMVFVALYFDRSISSFVFSAEEKDAGKVVMSRTYWNKLEDDANAHEVPLEDRVQAYAYGKEKVWVGI